MAQPHPGSSQSSGRAAGALASVTQGLPPPRPHDCPLWSELRGAQSKTPTPSPHLPAPALEQRFTPEKPCTHPPEGTACRQVAEDPSPGKQKLLVARWSVWGCGSELRTRGALMPPCNPAGERAGPSRLRHEEPLGLPGPPAARLQPYLLSCWAWLGSLFWMLPVEVGLDTLTCRPCGPGTQVQAAGLGCCVKLGAPRGAERTPRALLCGAPHAQTWSRAWGSTLCPLGSRRRWPLPPEQGACMGGLPRHPLQPRDSCAQPEGVLGSCSPGMP